MFTWLVLLWYNQLNYTVKAKRDLTMKKFEIIVITILMLVLGVVSLDISVHNFDRDDAALALGDSFDLTDGWTITYEDGTSEKISFPFDIPSEKAGKVLLEHDLSSDYAGLALDFEASNSNIEIFIDDIPLYRSSDIAVELMPERPGVGAGPQGSRTGQPQATEGSQPQAVEGGQPGTTEGGQPGESEGGQPDGSKVDFGGLGLQDDVVTQESDDKGSDGETQQEFGQVLVDLPLEIFEGSVLRVTLSKLNGRSGITIYESNIAKRDVVVMWTVQSAIFPLLCGIVIIISAVILIALDALRMIQRKRTRGLIIIALFALDAIFYSFIRTEIFFIFLGNRHFFQVLEEISYILMPVILTGFFFRGFKIHFPTGIRILFYLTCVVAFADLLTFPMWGEYHDLLYYANIVWKALVIFLLMYMLVKWKQKRPESRQIFMDEAALVCLMVSILANPTQHQIAGWPILDKIKMLATTGYFVFMDVQHIQIMLAEYRRGVEAHEHELQEMNENLIVEHQKAEEAKEEAILANKAKSRFLANMSHEIRTPINAVLGMDEMILRETKDKSVREYAFDIKSAGQTLLSLVNEILDFSKIESGKMEIVPVEYDFAELITNLVNLVMSRAQSKGLELYVEIDENVPVKMFGDDVRIRQCVTNVLTNAVKYTQEGSVTLRTNGERDGDDFLLRFEVEDTGIGIKEEDIPKLFKEYERIEESRNRNIEGTGLGMNITREMLFLMDSRLEVSSVYGEGSKFWFTIRQPIVDATPVGDFRMRHEQSAEEYDYSQAFVAPEAHVLVVDDNAMNRKVFINLLKATEINVEEADSGFAAVEIASEHPFHMIFMDHMMPEMDGIQAMHKIRENKDGPNAATPIFVLTANAVAGAKEMYLQEGFDGFLSKPVVASQIEAALKEKLPESLLLPAPEGGGMQADDANEMPDDFPMVDGLDWNFAWMHLSGEDILSDAVHQFFELIPVHGGRLDQMYEQLPEESALDEYRIQVHGMKSSAATIGIIPLAGMAKILEFAAKDHDIDKIHALHRIFMDEWNSYREKLIGVFGIADPAEAAASLPEAEYGQTLARLEMLKIAMDDMDIDKSDELMEQLKAFRYPAEIADVIGQLSGAVADLDSDLVAELVDKIMDRGDFTS